MSESPVLVGGRVEVTAAQSYAMTWDEAGDCIVGEYGVLVEVSASALAYNTETGSLDSAPYRVRLDSGETVWAAAVRPEVEGLRRTVAVVEEHAERLRAQVAELEAAAYVAPSPSCTRCYGADAARFVAKGGSTTPCRVCGPSQVEQLEARLVELVERGIVGSADALPVPFGPQMPDFPPPPTTEVEKLRSERARLQDLLAEAVRDAHLARRERDVMRERVSEPYGCTHCGVEKRSHGRRWIAGAGVHAWERPAEEQVKARMLARRAVRMPLEFEQLRAQLAELEAAAYGDARVRLFSPVDQARHLHQALAAQLSRANTLDRLCREQRARADAAEARVADLEALTPAAVQTCRKCGAGYTYGEPCQTCAFEARVAAETGPSVAESADALTRLLAPSQALREDDPNGLHHTYRVGRDLPESGGAK